MPEISKCPKHMQLLVHWEALGEVSVLSWKNLLFNSSTGSYCRTIYVIVDSPVSGNLASIVSGDNNGASGAIAGSIAGEN